MKAKKIVKIVKLLIKTESLISLDFDGFYIDCLDLDEINVKSMIKDEVRTVGSVSYYSPDFEKKLKKLIKKAKKGEF